MVSTFTGIFKDKNFLTKDVATFSFDLKDSDQLDFLPGQYLIMHIPFASLRASPSAPRGKPGGEDFGRRIFSLITAPKGRVFEFLAKIIPGGLASEYFMQLKKNDEVVFQGPAGMFAMRQTQNPKIFIATGTGIAPVLSILRTHLARSQNPFYLIWGLKTKSDIYLLSELEEFTRQYPNFRYCICLSRETPIEGFEKQYRDNIVIGRVNKKIDEVLKSSFTVHSSQFTEENNKNTGGAMTTVNREPTTNSEFYICGDRNIVEDIRQYILRCGIPKESISFEKFV